jgi:hypothetical protein
VNRSSSQFFARATFTKDKNWRVRLCNLPDIPKQLPHRLARPYHLLLVAEQLGLNYRAFHEHGHAEGMPCECTEPLVFYRGAQEIKEVVSNVTNYALFCKNLPWD